MPPMSHLRAALKHVWTRDSTILLGGFILTIFLIVYIWWPLAEEYLKYVIGTARGGATWTGSCSASSASCP
jgi:hypothetical protein